MPGASYVTKYLDLRDKNGVRVGDWATQPPGAKGYVICRVCVPEKHIKFTKGSLDLFRHSERNCHIECAAAAAKSKQKTLSNFITEKAEDKVLKQARDLEIILVSFLSSHGVPPNISDCLTALMKKYIPDSEIVEKMSLGATKARYLTLRGVGEHAEKETIEKVKNCDAFSIGIDESEVNKHSELEIMVKFSSENRGIENKHLGCLDLEAGNAETIKTTVFDFLEEKNIDYKGKLIDVGMDGCATMMGDKNGVHKKMSEVVDELDASGSCNAHNLSNVMKHATKAFDGDIEDALVNVYMDLGGHEGYGLKKKKEFEALCESFGFKPSPFKRFVNTRFRTHRNCLEPVLRNYDYLVKYYKSLSKPTNRQKDLRQFFVDNQYISKLKLLFIYDSNAEFSRGIDFFEEKQSHVHNTGDKLEDILVGQYRKIFDESEINYLTEDDELKRKSRRKLINLDIESAKKLDNKKVFIGQKVEQEIKSLGLTPTSSKLTWFFNAVVSYHLTACKFLQKYFKAPLGSSIISQMSGLNPKHQKHATTPSKLLSLTKKHTKVIDNIRRFDGHDKVKEEIDRYVTDEEVDDINKNTNFETFWLAVGALKDGTWPRYEVLWRFALALGTKYDATSDVERSFSVMNYIHQNSQRNMMSQETLNAHLHIRSAVENKESIAKCDKCQRGEFKNHCHCRHFEITDSLRARCKTARRLESEALKNKSLNNDQGADEEATKKREAFEKEVMERKQKLKEDLQTGKQVWSSKHLEPVFSSRKKKDENKNPAPSSTSSKRQTGSSLDETKENSSKKLKTSQSVARIPKK